MSFGAFFSPQKSLLSSRLVMMFWCVTAVLALSACSVVPRVPTLEPAKPVHSSNSQILLSRSPDRSQDDLTPSGGLTQSGKMGGALTGRLIIKVAENGSQRPARSLNAHFELRGDAQLGALDLSTPLGSLLAQARWEPEAAWLRTPRDETHFDNLDALTQKLLGETLPMAALFDWLRARPWTGAPHQVSDTSESVFTQIGWNIDLSRWAQQAVVTVSRHQAPAVTVRAQLERP